MGLWSNILIAILSVVNPILGFVGSVVKYIVSEVKNAGFIFLLDLVSNVMPGGFAKDIAMGVITDAYEAFSINSSVDEVVPFNNIVLKCERCGNHSHYYVKNDGLITCKSCLRDKIDSKISGEDEIYILRNNIYQVKNNIVTYNKLSDSTTYNKLSSSTTFKRK